jgi:hypothetical protein
MLWKPAVQQAFPGIGPLENENFSNAKIMPEYMFVFG